MQIVCDDRKRIRDVFIGYPGSVCKSTVFSKSQLYSNLSQKCGTYILIADNSYTLTKQIMTPYKNKKLLTTAQIYYNEMLKKNRLRITHTFGMLKQKFCQLRHLKFKDITLTCHLIRTCCVLHNLSLTDEFVCDEAISADEDEISYEEFRAQIIRNEIAAKLALQ